MMSAMIIERRVPKLTVRDDEKTVRKERETIQLSKGSVISHCEELHTH